MPVEDSLKEAGFEVVHALEGAEAVSILQERASQFKALITDIRLPGKIDGWEIAHKARELNPLLAVVYVSADSGVDWAANGVPNSTFIQKPFASAQLITAVASLINASTTMPIAT